MRSESAYSPVSREYLSQICEWLRQHPSNSEVFERQTAEFKRRYSTVVATLDRLASSSDWPKDKSLPVSITGKEHGNKLSDLSGVHVTDNSCSTLNTIVSHARQALKIASEELFGKCACLIGSKNKFQLVWKNVSVTEQSFHAVSEWLKEPPRVEFVRSDYRGTFTDPFTRGIFSLADDWGIDIIYKREFQAELPDTLPRQLHEIMEERKLNGVRPIDAVVVNRGDPSIIDGETRNFKKRGVSFVTAGYFGADVSIDNALMGWLLGEAFFKDEKNSIEKRELVVLSNKDVPSNPVQNRDTSFHSALRDHGYTGEKNLRLEKDSRVAAKNAVVELMKNGQFVIPTAIAALSPPLLEGVLAAFEGKPEMRDTATVYGAGLTEWVIQTMQAHPQFLRAVSGVDPFYYGRYVLRAALHRAVANKQKRDQGDEDHNQKPAPFASVRPMILTPEEMVGRGIVNASTIAQAFPYLKLHDKTEQYAWAKWMGLFKRRYLHDLSGNHETPRERH